MATTADKYGYRKYLTEKGIKDDDITWDNNTVKVKGQFFGNATPEADGSTYDSKGNLDALYKAYQTSKQPTYQDRSNTLLDNVQQRLTQQQPKPFQYNPQADPLYQSALQAAQQGATTQIGNTTARLRAMGQGKSSYSEGVAQQIGQQAVADVNARTLPQLASQAYQRYLDDQNRERANSMDLLGLSKEFNSQHQQGLDNTFRQDQANLDNANRDRVFGEQQKQSNWDAYLQSVDRTGNLGTGPKVDYQLLGGMDGPASMQGQQFQYQQYRDQIKDEQYKQQFDEDARRYGLDYALRAAAQANQFANSAADNARANASLGLQRERFEFDKQQASSRGTAGGRTTYKENPEYSQELQFIYSNPNSAVKEIQDNVQALIETYGNDGYNDLLKEAQRVQKAASEG